ncbi:MAG TPA: ferrous iron transport protein B [Peptococcaceae bacterium]|nr:MAG: Small GTP-binding protein [Clostridia bacterium 41_269]HBT20805.1 ferrous iron transport protein B [Peptococcaceae bacterium]
MSKGSDFMELDIPPGVKKIVLAGNPNSGKSVLFNALTGMYVDVSNYPGTTLEISYGKYSDDAVIIDTPGVYGISSFNDEERTARDIILKADIVVNIINALHLERDLFLTQQIIDTGLPVIVALNMMDEAERQGLSINIDLLSSMLGVKVIPMVAIEKKGLEELKNNIFNASRGITTPGIEEKLQEMEKQTFSRGEALLILEGDPIIAQRNGVPPGKMQEEIYLKRRKHVNSIVDKVVKYNKSEEDFKTKLSSLMIRPYTGIPIFLLSMAVLYEVIGVFIAQTVVGFTEETIMQGYYQPFITELLSKWISINSPLWHILAGEFGFLTMPVIYLLGLLMPLVVGFYLMLSIFEDSGYLPRIAVLTDRILTSIGLNGRAVIPIILGFGCVTMATIVTRILGSDRERRIAIFLLGLTIPCSAQLGIIAGMLAGLGPPYVLLYILIIFSILASVGTLLNAALPGKSTDLIIDLPPLRFPRAGNVLKKTATKSLHFLLEAAPLFALGALIISVFQITGFLDLVQNLIKPITVGWLGLPKEATTAFIMGIIRRDFGAAGLMSLELDKIQSLVALVTITLFVPCIASIMMLFKERSKKEALVMWLSSLFIAFLAGGIISKLSKLTGEFLPVYYPIAAFFIVLMMVSFAVSRFKSRTEKFEEKLEGVGK